MAAEAERKAVDLASKGQLGKAKVGELKAILKGLSQSQTGEKAELAARVQLFVDGAAVKSVSAECGNPCALKAADLRKQLARRGLPCDASIETRDELVRRLIDARKAEGGTSEPAAAAARGDEAAGSGGGGRSAGDDNDAGIALAKQVLELAETGEDAAILSLGGAARITEHTPVAQMRRAYLSLSRSLHPDRLRCADATKAFQALVGAFERMSNPEPPEEAPAAAKKKKSAALARSNAGCHRTALRCPRCKVEWGLPQDGVEKYCYNFMMQGLKCFTCSTCLLEFGCMSAVHECPHCRAAFEYSPSDYHRQIVCSRAKCAVPFGFWLYHVPPRVEDELRAEVKRGAERRVRAVESARARAARAARKAGGAAEGADAAREQEAAFERGLLDACPRCGWEPPAAAADRESLAEHLRACTDKRKHAEHRKRKAAAAELDARKAGARARQDAAMTEAAFDFLGGSAAQLWLLSDGQLRKRCVDSGLESADGEPLSREERLLALNRHMAALNSGRLLTDGSSPAAGRGARPAPASSRAGGGSGVARPSAESLPDNLHALSLQQLRDVCAAHGFLPKGKTCDAIIREIETRMLPKGEPLLLE